jgi:hypothetical protein
MPRRGAALRGRRNYSKSSFSSHGLKMNDELNHWMEHPLYYELDHWKEFFLVRTSPNTFLGSFDKVGEKGGGDDHNDDGFH